MAQLGKYEILEEIGRGGFGIVYKARDRSLGRLVALKVLHPQLTVDPKFIENFKSEAQKLAQVEHSNVVGVHEINEVEGKLFIVMRYLPGGSLADRISVGLLEQQETLRIVREVAAGLTAGHDKGIIHRDVKPQNILFDDKGHAVVTDFGVARAVHQSSIETTSVFRGMVGTPYYRPPELWRGKPKPSPATDIYSLGCVLYEMLTGEVLFTGETPDQVMTSHVLEDAQKLMRSRHVKVPASIQPVLKKCLAKELSQRYQGMGSFVEDLSQSQTREPKKERLPALLPWGLLGILAVVLALILVFGRGGGDDPEPDDVAAVQEEPDVDILPTLTKMLVLSLTHTATERPTLTPAMTMSPTESLGIGSTKTNEKDSAEMVYIPAGKFLMGSEDWDSNESPEHTVYLDAYWIYKHEVTNAQFAEFIADTGYTTDAEKMNMSYVNDGVSWNLTYDSYWASPQGSGSDVDGKGNYPVIHISWNDAKAYCEWVGGRLPTEAEWEKAARGTDGRNYPWGDLYPTCNRAQFSNCSGQTVPVGSFPNGASPYGALDMAGNVGEWVADWYDADYYASSPGSNPIGSLGGDYRILHGGSWGFSGGDLRTSYRGVFDPGGSSDDFGFRCVLSEAP